MPAGLAAANQSASAAVISPHQRIGIEADDDADDHDADGNGDGGSEQKAAERDTIRARPSGPAGAREPASRASEGRRRAESDQEQRGARQWQRKQSERADRGGDRAADQAPAEAGDGDRQCR